MDILDSECLKKNSHCFLNKVKKSRKTFCLAFFWWFIVLFCIHFIIEIYINQWTIYENGKMVPLFIITLLFRFIFIFSFFQICFPLPYFFWSLFCDFSQTSLHQVPLFLIVFLSLPNHSSSFFHRFLASSFRLLFHSFSQLTD